MRNGTNTAQIDSTLVIDTSSATELTQSAGEIGSQDV